MKRISLLFIALFIVKIAVGSHLRCGYITAQPENCSSRDYSITLTVYTDTSSEVKFGEDGILNFGDGSTMIVPGIAAIPRPDLGPNIGIAQFTIRHIYTRVGAFLISYAEPNRNGGVLNMTDSFFTTFYFETRILVSNEFGCPASPAFLTHPVLQASAGDEFAYSMGVSSDDDDLITYELVVPFRDRNLPVVNYVAPANLRVNYLNGLITWDTNFGSGSQSIPGEYNFAVQVNQHVKTGETYTQIGYVRIDFQVIVVDDVPEPVFIQDNQELDQYGRLLVPENEERKIRVFFESTPASTLQAFSELAGNEEVFSFETYDSTHEETDFKVGILTVRMDPVLVRENPYLVTLRAKTNDLGLVLGSDINYLIYTDEIPDIPVIVPPVITGTEKKLDEFSVYPNPARDKIRVKLNQTGKANLTLFTMQGLPVFTSSFISETELTVAHLPPGIYICEVRGNNSVTRTIKVIKH